MSTTPQVYKLSDLLNVTLPPVNWTIPKYLPIGLTILAGRPKVGKSWLALQIALAVSTGGVIFNERVEPGKILYIALEDSKRRMIERTNILQCPVSDDFDTIIMNDFSSLIGAFHHGGAINLRDNYIKAKGYKLVVIDTLSRAFPGIKDIDKNQEVTQALAPIQEIAQEQGCQILIIDHHNKASKNTDPDPIDDIMGSTAKASVTDTVIGLYREKSKPNFSLRIVGRDIEEQTIPIKRDKLTMAWQLENPVFANPIQLTKLEQEIIDFLIDNGATTFTDIWKIGRFIKSSLWEPLQKLRATGEVSFDSNTKEYYV